MKKDCGSRRNLPVTKDTTELGLIAALNGEQRCVAREVEWEVGNAHTALVSARTDIGASATR